MVDETRDQSNKEQLTLWVSDDFTVSEEFVGLYYLSVIDAQSIVDAIKDAFLRFQIPFPKLRGQCYDGCSTMAGARAGVAVKIQELEPRAVFTHCYGHALNLAVNDTITKVPKMKECLDTCYEIVKLIISFRQNERPCYLNLKKRWVVMLRELEPFAQQGGLFVLNHYIVFLPTTTTFCCCGRLGCMKHLTQR